ncbi:MAG: class I SAM-dependent RNA methyltransferase [Pseudomonadota bacterium]
MAEEVTIATLGAQADGVTEDGLYVAGTLPGERVRVDRLVGPMDARARLIEVLSPSTDRVEPACPHFTECGGCAIQHASDALVAKWKTDLIRKSLAARGIEDVQIYPIRTSPPASRRRITVTARRTKKTIQIGFHAPGSDRIVPISACIVARPELIDTLPLLQELVPLGASRTSEIRMTLTLTEGGVDVAVFDAKEIDGPGRALLAGAANRASVARLSWNGEAVITRTQPLVAMGRAKVELPPGGFLQATEEGEAALVSAVRQAVGPALRIADLYAGSGTFTLPLASHADITAVEGDATAVEALDKAWRQTDGLHRIGATRRDLAHRPVLAGELKRIEALVIDPPRAGARVQCEQLAISEVPVIAAVSCNPATFARDARILLDGGYRLDWVQPVDQFRWATHVELAARFSRTA